MKREQPSKIERQLETVKKQVGESITIGKNVLNRNFLQESGQIEQALKDILGRYYVRIQKDRITRQIKFGVNGQVKKSRYFLYAFFNNLQKSSMKGYFLLGIQAPLLREIAGVQYTQLQRLELIGCSISSLQPLTWLNTNNFKSIYLRNNMITTLKSLHKTSFKNFTSIDLDCNFFNECNALTRMRTVSYDPSKNNKFYIYMQGTENIQHVGNINFVLKMQNVQTSLIGESRNFNHNIKDSSLGTYIKQPKLINAIYRLQVQKKSNTQ